MTRSAHRLYFEEFVLDLEQRILEQDGRPVALRKKTFGVLGHLVEHRHRVVSKEEMLACVWPGVRVEPQAVFQSISELRSVFGRRPFIRTVRGFGYQWVANTSKHPLSTPSPGRAGRWKLAGWTAALSSALLLTVLAATPLVSVPDGGVPVNDALLERARNDLANGDLDSADRYLSTVLGRNPDHLEARMDLAYVRLEQGREGEARSLAEVVHRGAIANGTEHLRMASAALMSRLPIATGQTAESYAREAVRIATRLELPVYAGVGYERLGELYRDQGKPDLAAVHWNRAIEHYHDSCPASETRVRELLASLSGES